MNNDQIFFDLVKSLSSSEKRYFKRKFSRQGRNNVKRHLTLFDIVDKLETYDEKEVIANLQDDYLRRHYRQAKYYLTKAILRILNDYHSEDSAFMQVMELLQTAYIAGQKELSHLLHSTLKKARALAEKLEDPLLMQIVMRRQLEIFEIVSSKLKEDAFDELHTLRMDIANAEKQGQAHASYLGLNVKMLLLYNTRGTPRTHEERVQFDAVMNDPPMRSKEYVCYYRAAYYYHDTRHTYHQAVGKSDEAVKDSVLALQALRSSQAGRAEYPLAVYNVCQTSLESRDFQHFQRIAAEFESISATDELCAEYRIGVTLRKAFLMLQLRSCCLQGEFDMAGEYLKSLKQQFRLNDPAMSVKLEAWICYNIFYAEFGRQNYAESYRWLRLMLDNPLFCAHTDIYVLMNIAHLILHYELENINILEYTLRSVYRRMSVTPHTFKLEAVVLRLIRELPRVITPADLKSVFERTKTEIVALKNDEYERPVLEVFDFESWLEAKIQNRSFSDVVKEYAVR